MRPACLFRHRAAFAFVGTPGQREESEHDIGDYEELFTPEGKTHLYRWDNNGMVWPRYHHTQYKHNGTWEVRGTVQYRWWNEYDEQENPLVRTISTEPAPDPPPGPWTVVGALLVSVCNLVITSAPDYLIYDPEESPTLSIGYAVSKLVEETVDAEVRVYDTSQALVRTFTTSHGANGGVAVEWNGQDESSKEVPRGIYLFDVRAEVHGDPYDPTTGIGDSDQFRSNSLTISDTSAAPCGYNETTNELQFEVGYTLTNSYGRGGSGVTLRVFNPTFDLVDTQALDASLGAHTTTASVDVSDGGKYTFLVSAVDNDFVYHKGHRNRSAMERNANAQMREYAIILDPGHGGVDPGGIALDGSYEKTYNLDVALRTRYLLEHHWNCHSISPPAPWCWATYNVHMSRDSDDDLPRDERIERLEALADEMGSGPDALISFHCDTMGPSGTLGLWRKDIDLPLSEVMHAEMVYFIYGGEEDPSDYDKGLREYRSYVLGALPEVPGAYLEMVQIQQSDDLARIQDPAVQADIARAVHWGIEGHLPVP